MTDSSICVGCLRDGETHKSEAWCADCCEFVCGTCAKYHKRLSPPHNVVSKSEIHKLSSSLLHLSKCCAIHHDQKVLFYCTFHDSLICGTCISESHQACKQVLSIEKAAKNVKDGTALKDLKKRVDRLCSLYEKFETQKDQYLSHLGQRRVLIKNEISNLKRKLVDYLTRLEENLIADLETKFKQCCNLIVGEKSNSRSEIAKSFCQDLQIMKRYTSDVNLFHAIRHLDSETLKREREIQNILQQTNLALITHPCAETSRFMENMPSLGTVALESSSAFDPDVLDFVKEGQEHVKGALSLQFSFPTAKFGEGVKVYRGCFVDDKRILLTDLNDKCLHLCNLDGTDHKSIRLHFEPNRITMFDKNQAVVTGGEKGFIQIVNVSTLKPLNRINVGMCSFGIVSSHGKLWVYNELNYISEIDIKGKVLKKIPVSINPRNICVHDGKFYCNDYWNDTVFVLESDGTEQKLYAGPDLKGPAGLALTSEGFLYIAGKNTNTIRELSVDGSKLRIILNKEDGVIKPGGLSYNANSRHLLVINNDHTSIRIYRIP